MSWTKDYGYSDTWRIGSQFIIIDPYEDCSDHTEEDKKNGKCDCQEVWVGDDKSGNWDCEGIFSSYKEAKDYVVKFMRDNPNGWLDEMKPKEDEREKVLFD